MTSETAPLTEWDNNPLNLFLKRILPLYVTPTFNRLDVHRLRKDLDPPKSHEAIYKWLRSDKLTTSNVDALLRLANSPANLAARGARAKKLTHQDFHPFLFSS